MVVAVFNFINCFVIISCGSVHSVSLCLMSFKIFSFFPLGFGLAAWLLYICIANAMPNRTIRQRGKNRQTFDEIIACSSTDNTFRNKHFILANAQCALAALRNQFEKRIYKIEISRCGRKVFNLPVNFRWNWNERATSGGNNKIGDFSLWHQRVGNRERRLEHFYFGHNPLQPIGCLR